MADLLQQVESQLFKKVAEQNQIPKCDKCISGLLYSPGLDPPKICSCEQGLIRHRIFIETEARMKAIVDYLVKMGMDAII